MFLVVVSLSGWSPLSIMKIFHRLSDTVVGYYQLLIELSRRRPVSVDLSEPKKLLLLASEFAPAIAGGVYRPAALARYAQQSGRQVTVVTAVGPEAPSAAGNELLDYVGETVEILRYQSTSLSPSVRLFPQTDGGILNALQMVHATRKRFGASLPPTIVASGPSFLSFIAAYLLARACPEVRVVLEYRDEWTECPFDFVSKTPDDRRWESRCLARADQIIVTTESQRQHIGKVFGIRALDKCAVYPNGWEPAMHVPSGIPENVPHDRQVITFAGKLGGHTSPAAFLEAAAQVLAKRADLRAKLCFRFVGAKHADAVACLEKFPFPEMIESVPVVPLAVAQRLMHESAALILFHDQRFERYLPGKLYEYIASGAGILLLDDFGESSMILKQLDLGWSVPSHDVGRLGSVLEDIALRRRQVGFGSDRRLSEWLNEHTRGAIARRFLQRVC